MTFVVPAGAEAAAVRRAIPSAVAVQPGAACASALPDVMAGETVIVLGLCGSLAPHVRTGGVVVYARVADALRTSVITLDTRLAGALARILPGATVVDVCTVDRVVTTAAARTALARRSGAGVVDMEGTHLARALTERGARVAMVRVVSDDAARDLPPIEDAVDRDGRVRPLVIALAFARKPLAALAFVRGVRAALRTLTATSRDIAALAPPRHRESGLKVRPFQTPPAPRA